MAALPGIDRSSTTNFKIKRKEFTWLEIPLNGKRMLRALLKSAAVGKINTALMKAEKAQFSLEEKHKKASNDVSKKVKWLRDTVKNLTEMSSFFSEIASPYFPTQFKPEGVESEDDLFSAKR